MPAMGRQERNCLHGMAVKCECVGKSSAGYSKAQGAGPTITHAAWIALPCTHVVPSKQGLAAVVMVKYPR